MYIILLIKKPILLSFFYFIVGQTPQPCKIYSKEQKYTLYTLLKTKSPIFTVLLFALNQINAHTGFVCVHNQLSKKRPQCKISITNYQLASNICMFTLLTIKYMPTSIQNISNQIINYQLTDQILIYLYVFIRTTLATRNSITSRPSRPFPLIDMHKCDDRHENYHTIHMQEVEDTI